MRKTLIALALAASPLVAVAQSSGTTNDIAGILTYVYNFLNALIPILIAAAVVYFLFGLIKYVVSDDSGREEAKFIILYGIIVITVMVAVWGLVNILITSFGLNATSPNNPGPQLTGTRVGGGGGIPPGGGLPPGGGNPPPPGGGGPPPPR